MAYKTECPECGSSMNVVDYRVSTSIPLTEDGFSPMDAKSYCTEGEWVVCSNEDCDFESALEDLEEDPEPKGD